MNKGTKLSDRFWASLAQKLDRHRAPDRGLVAVERAQAVLSQAIEKLSKLANRPPERTPTLAPTAEIAPAKLNDAPTDARVRHVIDSTLEVLGEELPGHCHLVLDIGSQSWHWGFSKTIQDHKAVTRMLFMAANQSLQKFGG